jgi:hypothetical protein
MEFDSKQWLSQADELQSEPVDFEHAVESLLYIRQADKVLLTRERYITERRRGVQRTPINLIIRRYNESIRNVFPSSIIQQYFVAASSLKANTILDIFFS